MRAVLALLLVSTAAVLGGCRQNDDPDGARALYAKVHEGAGFRAAPWQRAPGFPRRKPSFTAHSNAVEIWVNAPIAEALSGPQRIREWPVGSIVVKEGFSGDERKIVAIMEKRGDGWHWVETDGEGEPLWSAEGGKPDICIGCHDNRAVHSDWLYSFDLPR